MLTYLIDLILVAVCVIGITAINGVLTNAIGEKWFGGKTHSHIFNQSKRIQSGWNQVGGKKHKR
ncbi:hypothetical protein ACQKL6_09840 [Peribacillus sp. NPDC097197]|uniref:hypothetical protein n=1 Tax=unclassified Peribacillus TaxID=2675266 RepID=UPI0037F54BF6